MDTLLEWLEPYKGQGLLDYRQSSAVAKLFHSYVEQLPKIEVGLVSCLRLMTKIALVPDTESASCPLIAVPIVVVSRQFLHGLFFSDSGSKADELCYKRAMLDLYSEGCFSGWIKILDVRLDIIEVILSTCNILHVCRRCRVSVRSSCIRGSEALRCPVMTVTSYCSSYTRL